MNLQKFNLFIPYEIGDLIKIVGCSIIFEVLDIQYSYSIKEESATDVSLVLRNTDNDKTFKIGYDVFIFEMFKTNKEVNELNEN